MTACIDPISFDSPPPADLIIVDGSITDQPGPYKVKVTRGIGLDADSVKILGVHGVKIQLISDEGEVEDLTEDSLGIYSTKGLIRGKIGHRYHITLEMPDGATFKSEPEVIRPSGEIADIRVEYEYRTVTKPFGVFPADVFNIFVDGNTVTSEDDPSFIRWRYTGTYKVETNPEFHVTFLQVSSYMTPLPCSGYIVVPALGGGKLEKVGECTCCVCWCQLYETEPQLSDTQAVTAGQFRNVKVGEVPVNNSTFHDKYMVEVEQMAISKEAFDFFKLIRNQKLGASNLFQPPPGVLRGNVRVVNSSYEVVGLFWAASVYKKEVFVHKTDLPYPQPPIDQKTTSCFTAFRNASVIKPENWDE
jgi:hypothetical protein